MPGDAEVLDLLRFRASADVIVSEVVAISFGKPEYRIRRKQATQMKFKLKAQVSRSEARTIRRALEQLAAKGSVRKADEVFVVEAEMEGTTAREMNRTLLSALRKVERKTTLRAEWTSGDNTPERFFDYVLKKTFRN